jgi:hydroxyethylthiazole kinase-like uncharacterized protein yjeF
MKIVNARQMAEIDQETQNKYKIPAALLMENAGQKLYTYLNQNILTNKEHSPHLVFLVGRGNNAGDALVIARQCAIDGWKNISIILGNGEPTSESLACMHLNICRALQLVIIDYTKQRNKSQKIIHSAHYIIDGLLGTGISDQVREPLKTLIREVNKSQAHKIAVDVPSGIGDNFRNGFTALKADDTLTVELPKQSFYLPYARPYCGIIRCLKIGFPNQVLQSSSTNGELLNYEKFFELLPVIPKSAHKTVRGHCAVFAGSVGTTGAAYLSTMAAARSRVGLVTLFTDPDAYPLLAPKFSSAMIRPYPNDQYTLQDIKNRFSGLLIGPGWGVDDNKLRLLENLLSLNLPGVIDADGITVCAELMHKKKIELNKNIVFTPHPGEFIRICGGTAEELLNDPLSKLHAVSRNLNTPIILKAHVSYLVSPSGDFWILDGMNPALATGGSGDVLAGILAGFIASGINVLTASKLGMLLHAKLGEYLFNKQGWFLAEDLLPEISHALHPAKENDIWQ